MKAGTMENLIGANNNAKMTNIPMRAYNEAERRGDISAMERAMKYVSDCTQKAYEYKEKAEEELLKEQKEERERQKVSQEEMIHKHREDAKEVQQEIKNKDDSVDISDEGKKLFGSGTSIGIKTVQLEATGTKIYSHEGKSIEQKVNNWG